MWSLNYTMIFLLNPVSYLYMGKEQSNQNLIVETKYGRVLGSTDVSREGRTYFEYLGMPYATPPVGDLRYKSPIPPSSWVKVRDGTSYGSKCSQVHLLSRIESGSEDCLYINVYTHQIKRTYLDTAATPIHLHPVIVFIHGGGYMGGNSNVYGAKYMMDQDVVFVTFNYRLASFGFLNAGIEEAQGNMGLKDQSLALRWVRENIAQFGGDPNRVTIVGQSAGLFHGAISASATALAPWVFNARPIEQFHLFASKLNCTRPTPQEAIACLRARNTTEILRVHTESTNFIHDPLSIFRPSVELLDNEQTFMADHPVTLIRNGETAPVPFLTGANNKEGLIFAAIMIKNSTVRYEANTNWRAWAPILFGVDHGPVAERERISDAIRAHYLQDKPLSMSTADNVTDMMTDRNWFQPLHNLAAIYREKKISSPLYLYYYSYRGQFSLGKLMFGMTMEMPILADAAFSLGRDWFSRKVLRNEQVHYGACHSDENVLLYHLPLRGAYVNGTDDYDMSRTMVELWTSFATNGKPSHSSDSQDAWPPISIEDESESGLSARSPLKYYHLDRHPQLIDEPFSDRVNFWNSLNITFPNVS